MRYQGALQRVTEPYLAAQGVEAQTLANVYLALDHDLDVFPVINKVDLPSARPDEVAQGLRMSSELRLWMHLAFPQRQDSI